jgi:integrase
MYPKLKAVLKLDKKLANGTYPLFIRITYKRKPAYVSIGYGCLEEEWNELEEQLWETKPRITQKLKEELSNQQLNKLKELYSNAKVNKQAKKINREIENKKTTINSIIKKLDANGESLDVKNIKNALTSKNEGYNRNSFIEFYAMELKIIEGKNKYNTYRNHKGTYNLLSEDYLKGKDLFFNDFNLDFLEKFELYLKKKPIKKEKFYKTNAIHKQMKNIRAIYNRAVKKGLVEYSKNPFLIHKLTLDKYNRKVRLTAEEIRILQNLNLEKGSRLNDSRNLFLFAFYHAGIRIGDLLQLKWKDIVDGRLEYKMDKNNKIASLLLAPIAIKIIEEYKGYNRDSPYIFPFFYHELNLENEKFVKKQIQAKTSLINNSLKKIAKIAGIEKNISTHTARHSFADIARKKTTDIHALKNLFRHGRIGTTESYIETLDYDSQDDSHQKILEGF